MFMTKKSLVLIATIAGAAVACGGSSSNPPGGAGPYIGALVIDAPQGIPINPIMVQVCTDSACATPISTATVTVNGSAVAWNANDHRYESATAVSAGQAVALSVTYGGKTYSASGTQFTQAPTITSPTSASAPASWTGSSANTFSWSGGTPITSGVEYVAGVMDANGNFVYPAPSSSGHDGPAEMSTGTTSMTIPANTLPNGTYQLFAGIATTGAVKQTSNGISIPGAASGSGLWLGAVAAPVTVSVAGSTATAPPYLTALVLTMPSGAPIPSAMVQVCTDSTCGTPITTATVSVNGTTVPWSASNNQYSGAVSVANGASVTVSVVYNNATYTASGTQFASAPTISSPANLSNWSASAANTISWTGGAPTTGASYVVGVMDVSTGNFVFPAGNNGPEELSTTTLSTSVPASTLTSGSSYAVIVGLGMTGISREQSGGIAFSPAAAAGSGLWLGTLNYAAVTATP